MSLSSGRGDGMESAVGLPSDRSRLLVESGLPDGQSEGVFDVDGLRKTDESRSVRLSNVTSAEEPHILSVPERKLDVPVVVIVLSLEVTLV